jgi:CDP-Glycerol:Poly(glycerophosphate) glycerophosphotransferase
VASFNPFSKVYDEIWVAGQAGRDRYARAKVGIRDDEIIEVGRPQLDMIERSPLRLRREEDWPTKEKPLTVLYAPTWEGWTDDGFQTSVTQMSIDIVKRLLKSPMPIRLIYKPHPMIGTRDPKAATADRKVRAMIAKAASKQGAIDPAAAINLESLSQRLASPALSDAEEERLLSEWNEVFWAANVGRHLVIDDKLPRLFDCFNNADMLITDVSSLISDWLASNKPYVVSNPKAMTDEEFRTQFPSSRAAYLLHPGCAEMEEILASVVGEDRMAPVRQQEKLYLLGPDEPSAQERWNAAVERLIANADAEWDGEHGSGPSVAQVDTETVTSELLGTTGPGEEPAAAAATIAADDPDVAEIAAATEAEAEVADAEVEAAEVDAAPEVAAAAEADAEVADAEVTAAPAGEGTANTTDPVPSKELNGTAKPTELRR